MLTKWAISCKVAKNDTYGPMMICRETSAKEREEADPGRGGEVPSPDLGKAESGPMFHLKSAGTETEPSWQVVFCWFFVWKIPVKWLLIYAKSNQQLIHNAWATRYQFCNAFRLLDAITNAADEILALPPFLLRLRGHGDAATATPPVKSNGEVEVWRRQQKARAASITSRP